tara:strand:+ start:3151 stop:3516 length:366 start_codon:yes stop_codon:yes gene_type:complete
MQKNRPTSVITMDYNLNMVDGYDSLTQLCRDLSYGNRIPQYSLKILHSGRVSSYQGRLIILKKFYNESLDFEYTAVAAGLCNRVLSSKQKLAYLRFRNNYNRRVAILNHDLTIKEVLMCSM